MSASCLLAAPRHVEQVRSQDETGIRPLLPLQLQSLVSPLLRGRSAQAERPASLRPATGLAFIVHTLNPGGAERLVAEMAKGFCDEFRVIVVCLDEPGRAAGELRARGIPVYCLWRQAGLDLLVPIRLARLCREQQIGIIHANQSTAWLYAALSRVLFATPRLLFEEHGRFFPERRNPRRLLANRVLADPLTHGYVAVCQDIRKRLHDYEGIRSDRIEVIYNGIRVMPALPGGSRQVLRASLGLGPGDFVVGTAGRFDPIKNLPMLIDAVALAGAQRSRVRGLLIGDGPEFAQITARVKAAGQQERIVLAGFRADARSLIACMDLFVLSSVSEGTSLALLEAMQAGVPVAVTAVGGNPEIVSAGETGWLVGSGDVAGLAKIILQAEANGELGACFAAAARRQFQNRFTFDAMIDAYRQFYQRLLSGKLPEPPVGVRGE